MSKCIDPAEIQKGDLMTYIDGQADMAVQNHIQRCAYCAKQAVSYRPVNHLLLTGLYRASCPPPLALAQWQAHLLPTDEELQVAAHVGICPHCTRELEELTAADDTLPAALLDRLQNAGRWIEATLATTPQAVRKQQNRPMSQQRYQVGALNIFVSPQQIAGRRRLMGRLAPPAEQQAQAAAVSVWLVQADQAVGNCSTNNQGRFVFSNIASGRYDLGFDWQEQAVLIRGVEV